MAIPSISYSSPGLGQSLTANSGLQGMTYQAPNPFAGTGLDTTVPLFDMPATTGSAAIDNYTPMEIGTDPEGGFFSDGKQMAGLGSLVSAGAGLANTLAMMPILREQRKTLEQNRQFAAEDQLARRTAKRGFNSFKG